MNRKIIAFLTDLGLLDDAVGICKGLMLSICPDATIIDVTHSVTPFDVYEGSLYLSGIPSHFPEEIVIACFVFPETGTDVKCLALRNHNDQVFVAPNNGLLTHIIETSGIQEAYEISASEVLQKQVAHTFHGRDIVVSTAAHLAKGFPFTNLGRRLDIKDIHLLDIHQPSITESGTFIGEISIIDKNYGNIWTNIPFTMMQSHGLDYGVDFEISLDSGLVLFAPLRRSFGEVEKGKFLIYINSRGHLAFGLNQGSFAEQHNIQRRSRVLVQPKIVDQKKW